MVCRLDYGRGCVTPFFFLFLLCVCVCVVCWSYSVGTWQDYSPAPEMGWCNGNPVAGTIALMIVRQLANMAANMAA